MQDELDALFARLATQPPPLRLAGLEAKVHRSLACARASAVDRSWRYAAVSLALIAGMGVGGFADALRDKQTLAADLADGVRLAPSSLLDASG